METLRTPEDRFVGLPGVDFAPHCALLDDRDGGRLRVHGRAGRSLATTATPATITDAGHFLQEDKGEELAAVIVDFVTANPVPTTSGAHR